MSEKQADDLNQSLKRFSLVEIPVINTDNLIIAGHQRIEALRRLKGDDFEIDVRVPEKKLTQKQVDEYLIRSNKNTGEWDWDTLANVFDQPDLVSWGFAEDDFFDDEEKTGSGGDSFNIKTIKIRFESNEQLKSALNDLTGLLSEKYPDVKIKATSK